MNADFLKNKGVVGRPASVRLLQCLQGYFTPHIWKDDQRRLWIDDSDVKVIELVLDHVAYGWIAEEIHAQHSHLSLGQIYTALTYYYDHQAELDDLIEQSRRRAEVSASESVNSASRKRLRAAGKA